MSNIGTRLSNIENKLGKIRCPNLSGHSFCVFGKDGKLYEVENPTIPWDKSKECNCGQPTIRVLMTEYGDEHVYD